MQAFKVWSEKWERLIEGIPRYTKATVSLEPAPALLGVGYIIGPRIASVLVGGGLLTSLLLVPMIAYFAEGLPDVLPPAKGRTIHVMDASDLRVEYVRYIGAGAVATGGILSMLNALPLILGSIGGSFRSVGGASGRRAGETPRTDRDIPIWIVMLGTLGLVAAVAASNLIPTNTTGRVLGGVLVVVFGFFFVTVSSRITGVIGSSSNPISGMTIATLLLTCLIFVLLGWTESKYQLAALSIAGVVCIASSNGGTTSQDLKTGFLVGATPWKQQVAILVGGLVSAIVMGGTLLALNSAYTTVTDRPEDLPSVTANVSELTDSEVGRDGKTYKVWWVGQPRAGVQPGKYLVDDQGKAHYLIDPGVGGRLKYSTSGAPVEKFNPPQPALFATIIDGIMRRDLAWGLVMLGAVLAVVMQLAGVSALAFAVGVYLPLATTLPIFVGGMVRAAVDRSRRYSADESEMSSGVMMSTGLIAGGSLAGIFTALLVYFEKFAKTLDFSWKVGETATFHVPAIAAFGTLAACLLIVGLMGRRPQVEAKPLAASSTDITPETGGS